MISDRVLTYDDRAKTHKVGRMRMHTPCPAANKAGYHLEAVILTASRRVSRPRQGTVPRLALQGPEAVSLRCSPVRQSPATCMHMVSIVQDLIRHMQAATQQH